MHWFTTYFLIIMKSIVGGFYMKAQRHNNLALPATKSDAAI